MNPVDPPETMLEPERYELHALSEDRNGLDRRDFFKLLGSGLVVMFLADIASGQESGSQARPRNRGGGRPTELGAWLHIGEDGKITVFTGKTEVGQNIRTSLTQVVAEELRAPIASINMVMADTQLTPFDQGTFGSRTTPDMGSQLRRAAATAREALIDLAAEALKTDRAGLQAKDGKIARLDTGESLTYGQLTKGQKIEKLIGNDAKPTPPGDWKIEGTSVRKVGGAAFVNGRHKYASDISLPGMLHGRVLRPRSFGAKLTAVKTAEAQAMTGVKVAHDGDFVAVAAPDSLTAERALDAIKADWEEKPQVSSKDLFEHLKKTVRGGPGDRGAALDEALAAADHKLSETYTIAYIAHTPLEPRAAGAEWKGGKLTVWTGTQRPFGVRSELADAYRAKLTALLY